MEKIHQQLITLVEKDRPEEQYVVYTIFYREGMFFLYLPADSVPVGITEYLSNRETVLRELMNQRLPTLFPLAYSLQTSRVRSGFVLSCRLKNILN